MKRQNQTKQIKKKKLPQQAFRDGLLAGAPNDYQRIPKTVGQCFPDRYITRLTYRGYGTVSILAAATAKSYRYQPTAVYDVDPTLGSTTTVGFAEFASIYNNYRCFHSKFSAVAASRATTPVQLVVIPLNADPGASPSLTTIQEWVNNPYAKHSVVAATGGPKTTVAQQMSTEKIYGSKMIYFDDNFAALVNAIPVNNWYWALAILAPSAAATQIDIVMETNVEMDVEFYGRKNLNN